MKDLSGISEIKHVTFNQKLEVQTPNTTRPVIYYDDGGELRETAQFNKQAARIVAPDSNTNTFTMPPRVIKTTHYVAASPASPIRSYSSTSSPRLPAPATFTSQANPPEPIQRTYIPGTSTPPLSQVASTRSYQPQNPGNLDILAHLDKKEELLDQRRNESSQMKQPFTFYE